ncbi:MAG: zinc-finger domain-containing protein [Parvibaculales bacterium]
MMQQQSIHKIANEYGEKEIFVAVKEFECIGAPPPHDHPHIFLDMGNSNQIICPYCGTRFFYKA